MKAPAHIAGTLAGLAVLLTTAAGQAAERHVAAKPETAGGATPLYPTIAAAVAAARPGDVIVVHAGTYCERVMLGSALTLRAAPGERAILSGFQPIRGWQPAGRGVYVTTVPGEVDDLFVGFSPQPLAVWPPRDAAWLRTTAFDRETGMLRVTPPPALADSSPRIPKDAAAGGAFVFALLRRGNFYARSPIERFGTAAGTVILHRDPKRPFRIRPGDRCILCGHPEFIAAPGEWAFANLPNGKKRLFFRPRSPADLEKTQHRSRTGTLLLLGHWRDNQQNIRVEGMIVAGGNQGLAVHNARGVIIERCLICHNRNTGIGIRPATDVLVRHCGVFANSTGISVASSAKVTIEENEVAANWVDGIVIAGDVSGRGLKHTTRDVVVRRNYVHHHLFLRHPDNFQTYRGVANLRLEENLALWAGQGLMTQETRDCLLRGNVFFGTGAVAVIFGHGSSHGWRVESNTIGLGGWGAFNLTGKDHMLIRNIVYGNPLAAGENIGGDDNLVWPGRPDLPFAIASKPWRAFATAAEFARALGHDRHSLKADPRFRNAPAGQVVMSDPDASSRGRLVVRGLDKSRPTRGFAPGDAIEINGDGVRRRITRVEDRAIAFAPPLPARPFRITLVWNWGKQQDFTLDLRQKKGSPVNEFPPDRRPGAALDIAGFLHGDFDGDGRRDLPEIPPELQAAMPEPNAPPIPFTIR